MNNIFEQDWLNELIDDFCNSWNLDDINKELLDNVGIKAIMGIGVYLGLSISELRNDSRRMIMESAQEALKWEKILKSKAIK